jgi:hypothetical protein
MRQMMTIISSPYLRELLCKLREDAVYDPIVVDECDLIRSHYLNQSYSTQSKASVQVPPTNCTTGAECSVQFCTEKSGIAAHDRTRMPALQLKKLIHMYPIERPLLISGRHWCCRHPFTVLIDPDNHVATLDRVEVAEVLSVYRNVDIRATKLRQDESASLTGKVVLRLDAIFGIPDTVMNDLRWMTSTLAVSRRLLLCYDDVN